MGNAVLSVLMNAMMAGLLLATIIYCLKLNKRIRLLQDSKSELAHIIREFDESTKRATQNINEIHAATMRISDNIQHKIDKANFLADDLEVLISRGNKMAGKPDSAPAVAPRASRSEAAAPVRTMADIMPTRSATAATASQPAPEVPQETSRRPLRMRSRAEQELMNLIGKKTGESNG